MNPSHSLKKESRKELSVSFPKFEYEQDRWATTRTQNVEDIASQWEKSPYKVRVLSDRKLASHSMVLLRKDTFEKIISLLRDLESGDAVVRNNFEAVFNSLKLVEQLASESTEAGSSLQRAINTLIHICGTINSQITYAAPQRKVLPAKLSLEERQALAEIESNEK